MRPWWAPQPSKLLYGSNVIDEFDSHTLPQRIVKVILSIDGIRRGKPIISAPNRGGIMILFYLIRINKFIENE